MFPPFTLPDKILAELGIEDPKDLDLEAIAMACGATVVYRDLKGSDARIIGNQNRAIITVRENGTSERKRFSIAHELGHWMRDRGKVSFSCEAEAFLKGWSDEHPEVRANRFAAELLLPKAMIQSVSHGKRLTWTTVRELTPIFKTSLTATAIRLAEIGGKPGLLVCTSSKKREWFIRNRKLVPEEFWPYKQPMRGSFAFEMHQTGSLIPRSGEVDADTWIDAPDSSEFTVWEESIRVSDDAILSLIEWRDEDQLIRHIRRSH